MKHHKQETGENLEKGESQDVGQPEAQQTVEQSVAVDLESELAKQKDAYLRLYAEFDNYKKRSAREKSDWIKFAASDVLSALLPVVDDLERGMAAQAKEHTGSADAEGFALIYHKMMDILRQKGLIAIEVKAGDALDVDYHDAIARIPAPEESLKGKIVDVTQKGYKIGDHVIRYAKVVVGE